MPSCKAGHAMPEVKGSESESESESTEMPLGKMLLEAVFFART